MSFEVRAQEDIVHALNTFKDLKPFAIQHVFPNGEKRLCLSLSGTLPVNYKVNFIFKSKLLKAEC